MNCSKPPEALKLLVDNNVDDAIVWDILSSKLPSLATEVEALID